MSYTLDKPIDFKKFKHSTTTNPLVINPIEKKKVSFKMFHLKQKIRIIHYLLIRILFPKILNHGYVNREDLVFIYLIT